MDIFIDVYKGID